MRRGARREQAGAYAEERADVLGGNFYEWRSEQGWRGLER
jgi:hypothetical protein